MPDKDDLEERFLLAQLRVAAAQDMVAHSPTDAQVLRELEAAMAELEAVMVERAKRSGQD